MVMRADMIVLGAGMVSVALYLQNRGREASLSTARARAVTLS